jgi:mono/diheme cytochrome c family protein
LLRISLLVIVLGVATALTVAVYVRTTGFERPPAPNTVETRTARFVRGFAVPPDVRVRTNPLPASPEAIAAGLAHFADHCASCHANDGSGNVTMGRNLYPEVTRHAGRPHAAAD